MLLTKHFIINRESSLEHVQGTQNVTHGQYHSPTKAPTMAPVITCEDDVSYTFTLENENTQNCAWFSKNALTFADRQAMYCNTTQNGRLISEVCCAGCTFTGPETS